MQVNIDPPASDLKNSVDLSQDKIFALLPETAKPYYHPGKKSFDFYDPTLNLIHHHSTLVNILRKVGLLLTFPVNIFRHRLVNEDQVALANYNGKYVFKGPGRQFTLIPWVYSINQVVNVNQNLIKHGPMTLVRVKDGELRYAINRNSGEPLLLGPGTHFFNDPCIVYQKEINFNSGLQAIGNCYLINISEGQVGISYTDTGSLKILGHGFHFLKQPERLLTTISIQQEFIEWTESIYTTADNVKLTIEALLGYRVVDPLLAFKVGMKNNLDMIDTLRQKAESTLSAIIRSVEIWDIGKQKIENISVEQIQNVNLLTLQDNIANHFIQELQKNFGDVYGVYIESLDILNFEYFGQFHAILDTILENTLKVTSVQNQEKLLAAETRIAETNAKKEQSVRVIKAEADANILALQAQSEAKAIQIKADAEAYKTIKQGEAKNEFARLVGSTRLGHELAVADITQKTLSHIGGQIHLTTAEVGLDGLLHQFMGRRDSAAGCDSDPDEAPRGRSRRNR